MIYAGLRYVSYPKSIINKTEVDASNSRTSINKIEVTYNSDSNRPIEKNEEVIVINLDFKSTESNDDVIIAFDNEERIDIRSLLPSYLDGTNSKTISLTRNVRDKIIKSPKLLEELKARFNEILEFWKGSDDKPEFYSDHNHLIIIIIRCMKYLKVFKLTDEINKLRNFFAQFLRNLRPKNVLLWYNAETEKLPW